jgi:hypothetical protein
MNTTRIIEAIQSDIDLQIHILSHFSEIDDQYREQLLMLQAINSEEMDKLLALTGSKFHPDFAKNPLGLAEQIFTGLNNFKTEFISKDLIIFYPEEEYRNGIGTDSIIHLSELNEAEISNIRIKNRSEVEIKTIQRKLIPTWQLNIVFDNSGNQEMKINTIFPGKYAPPFPERKLQEDGDYERSLEFWNNHVFLMGK